jgi:hypothetical protein
VLHGALSSPLLLEGKGYEAHTIKSLF